uniref:GRIP domain-containing protein n=1 Tax=Palpitomonas bilix TaxID=652834 RepID=A0A7S3G2X5_9EUKA
MKNAALMKVTSQMKELTRENEKYLDKIEQARAFVHKTVDAKKAAEGEATVLRENNKLLQADVSELRTRLLQYEQQGAGSSHLSQLIAKCHALDGQAERAMESLHSIVKELKLHPFTGEAASLPRGEILGSSFLVMQHIDLLRARVDSVDADGETAEEPLVDFSDVTAEKVDESDLKRREVEERTALIEKLKEDVSLLEQSKEAVQKELEHANSLLSTTQTDNKKLEKQLRNLAAQLEASETENRECIRKLEQAQSLLKKTTSERKLAQEQHNSQSETIAKMQEERETLITRLSALEEELASARAAAESSTSAASSEVEQLQAKMEKARELVTRSIEEKKALEDELNAVNEEMKALISEKETLEVSFASLEKVCKNTKDNFDREKSTFSERERQLELKVSVLEQDVASYSEKLLKARQFIERSVEEKKSAEEALSELRKEMDDQKLALQSTKERVEEEVGKRKVSEDDLAIANEKAANVAKNWEESLQKIKQLEALVNELNEKASVLEGENSSYKKSQEDGAAEREQLTEKLAMLENEARSTVENSAAENKKLRERCKELEENIKLLESSLPGEEEEEASSAHSRVDIQSSKKVSELEGKLERLKRELAVKEDAISQLRRDIRTEQESGGDAGALRLRDEVRRLQASNAQLEEDYKLQVQTLQKELTDVSNAAHFTRENFEYLRNTVTKFIRATHDNPAEHEQLIPVLGSILKIPKRTVDELLASRKKKSSSFWPFGK